MFWRYRQTCSLFISFQYELVDPKLLIKRKCVTCKVDVQHMGSAVFMGSFFQSGHKMSATWVSKRKVGGDFLRHPNTMGSRQAIDAVKKPHKHVTSLSTSQCHTDLAWMVVKIGVGEVRTCFLFISPADYFYSTKIILTRGHLKVFSRSFNHIFYFRGQEWTFMLVFLFWFCIFKFEKKLGKSNSQLRKWS